MFDGSLLHLSLLEVISLRIPWDRKRRQEPLARMWQQSSGYLQAPPTTFDRWWPVRRGHAALHEWWDAVVPEANRHKARPGQRACLPGSMHVSSSTFSFILLDGVRAAILKRCLDRD